jgi:ribonuclease J
MKDFLDELDNELKNEPDPKTLKLTEVLAQQKVDIAPATETFEEEDTTTWDDEFGIPAEASLSMKSTSVPGPRIHPLARFPETKFYLPTLRDGYTRVIPIWGNNETGSKNMNMFQYKDEILLVDCGVQFAEPEMLGANYSIPDISFLQQYKNNIKGFVITHAHLDHIGALKHILPALGMPTLFGTKLTLGLIKKWLEEAKLISYATFVEVDTSKHERLKIGNNFFVEFFRVNHSIPDCAGLCIETTGGARIVHTGDFKIDYTPRLDKPFDLERLEQIGQKWVTLFLSDSTASLRKWFSKSEQEVADTLEKIVSGHNKWRLIITMFSSWISRVQQIIDICEKYDKFIFLAGRSLIENTAIAKELWYITYGQNRIRKMSPKVAHEIPLEKQVIVTTWSQWEEFSALTLMAEGKHASIEIMPSDTVVFSSSVVPGNDRSVYGIINKLIRLWANVITKDDDMVHTWGHGQIEEQKILLNLVKPRYFMPVYGDLYFRHKHKLTAMEVGMKEENILLLDNGNIVDFAPDWSVFRSKIKVPIQDIIIDGVGIGTATSHVIKAREKMMNSGVLVVLYKVDARTKALLGHIRLETRGLVYLEEVRHIHRMIIKKGREVYENTVRDIPDIEEKDLLKIIRQDLEAFILQRLDREPMIIPIVSAV